MNYKASLVYQNELTIAKSYKITTTEASVEKIKGNTFFKRSEQTKNRSRSKSVHQ